MKANGHLQDDEGLDRILREWTITTTLPPRFKQRVWRRIEKLDAGPQAGGSWLQRLVGSVILRPGFASIYLSAVLAAGIAAGALVAQATTSRLKTELSMRYVESIDPYPAEFHK